MTLVNIDPHVIPHQKMHVSAVLIFEVGQLPLQHPVWITVAEKCAMQLSAKLIQREIQDLKDLAAFA